MADTSPAVSCDGIDHSNTMQASEYGSTAREEWSETREREQCSKPREEAKGVRDRVSKSITLRISYKSITLRISRTGDANDCALTHQFRAVEAENLILKEILKHIMRLADVTSQNCGGGWRRGRAAHAQRGNAYSASQQHV